MLEDLPEDVIGGSLEEFRGRYESGDRKALFSAIAFCGQTKTIMPDWVASAFVTGYYRWCGALEKSLDDAFLLTRPKNWGIDAQRKKIRLTPKVLARIAEAQEKGEATDQVLFDVIGEELNISGSAVRDYKYQPKRTKRKK